MKRNLILVLAFATVGSLGSIAIAEAASLKTITASAFAQTRSSDANFPFFFTFSFPDQPGTTAIAVAESVADTSVGKAEAFASATARRTSTGSLFFSTQEQQEILRRAPGALQALAVTNADAAPEGFEPLSPPELVNEEGIPLSIEEEFESKLNTSLEITFNDEVERIFFDFVGSALMRTDGEFVFSTGIRLESVELGLLRSFSVNERFELTFQGDWGLDNLSFTQEGNTFVADLDNLDFAIEVTPGFSAEDFQNLDFRFNGTSIVKTASVPEPSTILGYGLVFGLSMVSKREGLKRQKGTGSRC